MFANANQDYVPYSRYLMSLDKVLTKCVHVLPLRRLSTITGPDIPESIAIL
jgi:hypothetical protein